jgi:FkbM family methyltransferase
MMKEMLRFSFRRIGLELRKYHAHRDPYRRLCTALKRQHVDTLFDVGANKGQFALSLRGSGFHGNIVSFEPLSEAYASLTQVASSDPLWTIAPRCGVGAKNGTVDIQIAGNSASSSILDMTERHLKGDPSSAYIGKETIPIITLENYLDERPHLKAIGIKIDTQGYEPHVLEGLGCCWNRAKVIQVELSLTTLYTGEKPFREIYRQIEDRGYRCISLEPGFTDPETLEVLQVDAIFEAIPCLRWSMSPSTGFGRCQSRDEVPP